ncbi:MAG: hypothetical protein GX074_05540 [Erysipelothrix sp.]|nr:hypothetical protein [Erysipelothrix sp.]
MNERDGMTITFKALPDNKYYQYINIDYTKLSQDDLSEEEREILGISEFGSKGINLNLNLFVDDYLSIESDFIFMDSNAISSPLGCFTV